MSTYVIGDVHSCWASLKKLVKKLPSEAKILFIGDLVNRGPETLKCIRFAMKMGDQCRMLIGNHELHLLGVAARGEKTRRERYPGSDSGSQRLPGNFGLGALFSFGAGEKKTVCACMRPFTRIGPKKIRY